MDDIAGYYAAPLAPPPPPPHPHPHPHQSLYSHYHHTLPHLSHPPPLPPPHPVALHHCPPPTLSLSSPRAHHDEVRTLFIAGLPEDVKPREIFNIFRDFPGYLSSNLRTPTNNSQPFAFAVFADQQSAVAARDALNGMVFDLEKGSTLYIDLAKSNSRSKRQRTEDETGSDKKHRKSPAFSRGRFQSGVGSFHSPGMGNTAYNTIGYPSTQSHLSVDSRSIDEANFAEANNRSASYVPRDNPPCPTIFVANLGPKCSEQELNQVFSRCRGFLKLKIQSTYGAPVAFVDFQDVASSTEALSLLQGTILRSSPDGEGMRLEYAKSRMGKRRKS